MTVSTAPTPLSYSTDGSPPSYPITWKYNAKSHVVATLRSSAGVETVWALNTNYTLTDPGDSGTLTPVVIPDTGQTLFITLEPPNTQNSDIPLGGDFPSTTVEDALDLAAQRDGKIEALFLRALHVPKTDTQTGSSLEIPIDSDRASKFLAFDASGVPISAAGTSANLGPVSTFIDTLLDDTTAAVARTTLGAVGLTGNETVAGVKAFTGANTHSGSETFTPIQYFTAGIGPNYIQNIGIAPSVNAKALTVAITTKALATPTATDYPQIEFRNSTLTTGSTVTRNITAATSVVAPSGATLGFAAAATGYIYVYALDNAGTVEAVISGSNNWDEATVQSTTAIGTGSDSGSVLYSTTARTNVAIRYLGRIKIATGAVAGEWDNEDTEITLSSDLRGSSKGMTVASATTTDIWNGGNSCHISGTTTITSLGTAPYAGATKRVIFDGILTLTHGANLNLPGAANITTAAGDSCLVYADTTTQLDVFDYTKSDGSSITISASIVKQASLSTTTGSVSVATAAIGNLTLPGGEYGFYPTFAGIGGSTTINASSFAASLPVTTTAVSNIFLDNASSGFSLSAIQRYIQASPPYDLGDGEVPLFIFAKVNSLGDVIAAYVAPEAPWHYNGPTDIRAERYSGKSSFRKMKAFTAEHGTIRKAISSGMTRDEAITAFRDSPLIDAEITQTIKNADMHLIPHPFGNVAAGETVVLIDPISPLVARLAILHESGESINELLHDKNLIITNNQVVRCCPTGVLTCASRWR